MYSKIKDCFIAGVGGLGWALRGWRDLLFRWDNRLRNRFSRYLALRRNRKRHFRHELGVCAIFKNEAPFLDEWLTVHNALGVGHFYLYNNQSTDSYRTILEPWIRRGVVTLIDWSDSGGIGITGQVNAYNHCIRRFRMHARWIAFIDTDEFLFSPETGDLRGIDVTSVI
jgi:hypothetical protein